MSKQFKCTVSTTFFFVWVQDLKYVRIENCVPLYGDISLQSNEEEVGSSEPIKCDDEDTKIRHLRTQMLEILDEYEGL